MDIKEIYSFENLTLNTSLHYLKHDRQIYLSPKCTRVLALLAEHADSLVEKEHVLEIVWPDRFGADESLTRAISDIRKALKDFEPDAEKAIKTVPKRSYILNTAILEDAFGESAEVKNQELDNTVNSTTFAIVKLYQRFTCWLTKRIMIMSAFSILVLALTSYLVYYKTAPNRINRINRIAVLPNHRQMLEQVMQSMNLRKYKLLCSVSLLKGVCEVLKYKRDFSVIFGFYFCHYIEAELILKVLGF